MSPMSNTKKNWIVEENQFYRLWEIVTTTTTKQCVLHCMFHFCLFVLSFFPQILWNLIIIRWYSRSTRHNWKYPRDGWGSPIQNLYTNVFGQGPYFHIFCFCNHWHRSNFILFYTNKISLCKDGNSSFLRQIEIFSCTRW